MAPNQQSRWECSRRRGGTIHRGSRSLCAAALKFRGQILLRMDPQQQQQQVTFQTLQNNKALATSKFISLEKDHPKHTTSLYQIQRVYTKLEEPEKLRNLKAEGALSQDFALLPEKTFRKFLYNHLRFDCKYRKMKIDPKVCFVLNIQTPQMQLDEKYFQIWHKVWQPNPFEMVASVMSDKGFRQKYKQRNAEEVFCWLVYLNFSLIYQKSQAIIRIKNQNKKDPVEGDDDYAGPTGDTFQEGDKPKQEEAETYYLFIQKFFYELIDKSAAPGGIDLISALNVVALYTFIWEDRYLNQKNQGKNLSEIHRDMFLHLKSFKVVINKVKVDQEAEGYRAEFSRAIEILIKKLGEGLKNQ